MNLLEKIKFAFSKEQELRRKQQNAIRHKQLKNLLITHKKEFILTAITFLAIGGCIQSLVGNFTIDKLRQNNFENEAIIKCFYTQPCNQKIKSLDIKHDKQKVIDIAIAYQIKYELTN